MPVYNTEQKIYCAHNFCKMIWLLLMKITTLAEEVGHALSATKTNYMKVCFMK